MQLSINAVDSATCDYYCWVCSVESNARIYARTNNRSQSQDRLTEWQPRTPSLGSDASVA